MPDMAAVLLVWCGLSLTLLVAAYLGLGPGVFGKRADGSLPWWSWAANGPMICLMWLVWSAWRLGGGPCADEVAPGVWLGRRPMARELPPGVTVVDLVAEMPAAWGVAAGRVYVCLPTLDSTAPTLEALRAVGRIEGPVYIHCAQGRGRSAVAAAALLLARGLASSPEAAVRMLRERRPGVRLNRWQMRRLRELCP